MGAQSLKAFHNALEAVVNGGGRHFNPRKKRALRNPLPTRYPCAIMTTENILVVTTEEELEILAKADEIESIYYFPVLVQVGLNKIKVNDPAKLAKMLERGVTILEAESAQPQATQTPPRASPVSSATTASPPVPRATTPETRRSGSSETAQAPMPFAARPVLDVGGVGTLTPLDRILEFDGTNWREIYKQPKEAGRTGLSAPQKKALHTILTRGAFLNWNKQTQEWWSTKETDRVIISAFGKIILGDTKKRVLGWQEFDLEQIQEHFKNTPLNDRQVQAYKNKLFIVDNQILSYIGMTKELYGKLMDAIKDVEVPFSFGEFKASFPVVKTLTTTYGGQTNQIGLEFVFPPSPAVIKQMYPALDPVQHEVISSALGRSWITEQLFEITKQFFDQHSIKFGITWEDCPSDYRAYRDNLGTV